MWFDDLYRPGDTGKEKFDPKVWERGLKEWDSCFNPHELKVLADFDQVFRSVNDDTLTMKWSEWENEFPNMAKSKRCGTSCA